MTTPGDRPVGPDEQAGSPFAKQAGSPVDEQAGSPFAKRAGLPVAEQAGSPVDEQVGSGVDPRPAPRRAAARAPLWAWSLVVLGLVLAVVALVVALNPGAPAASPSVAPTETWSPEGADPAAYADALLAGTNTARAAEGLDPLDESACARDAAAERAQALTGGLDLVHASLTPVLEACGPTGPAAENLSRAAASPQAVVDAWLGSPGHRANLLDPELTEVGIVCLLDADRMLCSQVFLGT